MTTESAPAPVVLGIVSNGRGRFLLIRKHDEDRWLFPGGKIEPGESREDAIVREVLEETGISCQPLSFLGERTHPDSHRTIAYYLCRATSEEIGIRSDREIAAAGWFDGTDAAGLLGETLYGPARRLLLFERGDR